MIGKARSLPRHRFSFLLLLPAAAFLLISFSSVENRYTNDPASTENQTAVSSTANQMKVGLITWVNNTLFTDSQLNERLGIKSRDEYSIDHLNERLYLDEDAINSLYLDKGYLYFQIEVEEIPNDDGTMDLTFTIYEGEQFYIRQISITGNGSVSKEDILKEVLIKEGELFSKTNLIKSVRAIEQMDLFDPEGIEVNPTPIKDEVSGEFNKVDIEFKLTEK
jgi:outer membrane protein insertion porin family